MGKKKSEAESPSRNSDPEGSNNLQNKIENKNESDKVESNVGESSTLSINIDLDNEKTYNKDDVTRLATEASGSSTRPRRRCNPVSYRSPRTPFPESQPTTPTKKLKLQKAKVKRANIGSNKIAVVEEDDTSKDSHTTNQTNFDVFDIFDDSSDDENDVSNTKKNISSTSIAMDKLNFDIKIDPNVVDRYTDSGFTAGGSTPESPETRRERIDIISRQCRLHPANKKYNQGPVENPPLITPGKLVGYTPGGQRHEVDLNFDRPTWFNSEYARLQWDYATRVNVTRMFHELETGTFLPDGLDPNIERKYFAEQEMASKLATTHFEEISNASSSHTTSSNTTSSHGQSAAPALTEEEKEHIQLLETENELIELNKYAAVRFEDFAGEIDRKIRKALDLTLTPLMIKKNPVIVDTLETLASQCMSIEVVLAARAMLDKIKGLFQVPEDKEFREFFAEEVEKLKEKTKDMSGFDILMMTEEPPDDTDDEESIPDTIPLSQLSEPEDFNEVEDEWVPVENGDVWVDLSSYDNYANNDHSYVNLNDVNLYGVHEDEDDTWTTNDESGDSSTDESISDDVLEEHIDNLLETLVSEE